MRLEYLVGNDNGNSEHEVIINGNLIIQPNVNCEVVGFPETPQESSLDTLTKNIHDNLIVTVDSESISQPGTYFVGEFALQSGEVLNNMQVGLDLKFENDLPVINTLAVIAGQAVKDSYAKNKKRKEIPSRIEVDVDMATALPVIQFTRESAEIFEDKFGLEEHHVEVHLTKELSVDVYINFNFVKVLPESTIVTFALQKDIKGNFRKGDIFNDFQELYPELPNSLNGSYFKDLTLLHVDIGDGTSEFCITKGNRFLQNFTIGTNNGVGHAIEAALPNFNSSIHLIESPRQFLSEVLKDPDHKYFDKAMESIEQPLRVQEGQIIRTIKSLITKARNNVDVIVVYGGGSIVMDDTLYGKLEQLADERSVKLLYIPEEYATNIGVEGLYVFARSKIFEALKERAITSYEDHEI